MRIARPAQIATAMGMGESHVCQRLSDLRRAGLVEVDMRLRGASAWHATDAALAMLSIEVDTNRVPPLGQWTHELAAAGVSAAYTGLGHPAITARQIQSAVMATEHRPGRRALSDDPQAAPEVLSVPTGVRTVHVPDLCIGTADGWVAVEIEISRKRRQDLARVLLGYAAAVSGGEHPVASVTYITGSGVIQRAVQKEAREIARHRGPALDLLGTGALTVLALDPAEWGVI